VVQGTNILLSLTGDVYSNAPIATLTGGAWSNGQYFIGASSPLTISTSIFTGYASNVDGYIAIRYGSGSVTAFHSLAPQSNSLTYTMPANTLANGQTNTMTIVFFSIVNTNADLAGSYNVAYYKADTTFKVVALSQSQTQTVQEVFVHKDTDYLQTNATTAIVYATEPNPFGFGADVAGLNLGGITPPGLTLPADSTFNMPAQFAGQLGYNADIPEWDFGLINANDWGVASQAQNDSYFPDGTYQFVVQGTTVSLSLTGDAYPNAPVATLTGGAWSNGQYVMDAGNALAITTSTFTGYGANVDGYIAIGYGSGSVASYHSSAPLSNSLSYTLPANTLASGQTNQMVILFKAIVSTNADLGGSLNQAYYKADTTINVVTLPGLNVQPYSGGSLQLSFTGTLQESSDLQIWSDVSPQPASPCLITVGEGSKFFRSVNGN
jgi:hypothetical protein